MDFVYSIQVYNIYTIYILHIFACYEIQCNNNMFIGANKSALKC